jgi:hypothetical protein
MAQDEDFSVLNDMVTEAENYGVVASFHKPLLDTQSLSKITTSFATSLALSKTELTHSGSGINTIVKDVLPERKGAPDDDCVTDEWIVYTVAAMGKISTFVTFGAGRTPKTNLST